MKGSCGASSNSTRKRSISVVVLVIWTALNCIVNILGWVMLSLSIFSAEQSELSNAPGELGVLSTLAMINGILGLTGCYGLLNLKSWGLYLVSLYFIVSIGITIGGISHTYYTASYSALMSGLGFLSSIIPLIFLFRLRRKTV